MPRPTLKLSISETVRLATTEHDRPEIPVSVAEPIFTRRTLILDIDLSQKPALLAALTQLTAKEGWILAFNVIDLASGENFIVRLEARS